MKKTATQKDKQNLINKTKKAISQLRACSNPNCVQSTANNFINNLTQKDQDVLGGSFDNLTNNIECISNKKIDKMNAGVKIQTNIKNKDSLLKALRDCKENKKCIKDKLSKIKSINSENDKLGKEVASLTKKILECTNNLESLLKKLFHFKKIINKKRMNKKRINKKRINKKRMNKKIMNKKL